MLLQKNIVKKYLGMLDEQQTHEAWNQYQSHRGRKENSNDKIIT
jgi:hypothetical protein